MAKHLIKSALNSSHSLGQIQIIIIDGQNRIINKRDFSGKIGTKFNPSCILKIIPNGYHFVKVITGDHVNVYRNIFQRIVIEFRQFHGISGPNGQKHFIVDSKVAKDFIEYYNHWLLGMKGRPLRGGQIAASQYINGVNDARQGATPQSYEYFYQKGYRIYKLMEQHKHLKFHSVTLRQALLLTFNLMMKYLRLSRFYK